MASRIGALIVFAACASMLLSSSSVRAADRVLPQAPLIDQSGRAFSFASLRGKFVVLSFIYTRCRDANECPLTSARFARMQDSLGANVHLVEVTIDPAYDRPAVLEAYAKAYRFRPDRVTLLTGDPKVVLNFARALGVTAYTDPKYGFIHNENTVLIDPGGKVAENFPGNSWTPEEIAAVIAHRGERRVEWSVADVVGVALLVVVSAWIAARVTRSLGRQT